MLKIRECGALQVTRIVYDLTEVFLASTGRFPYYGIVRVVEEIGCELYRQDPNIHFAIFSHAYNKFFESFKHADQPLIGFVDDP